MARSSWRLTGDGRGMDPARCHIEVFQIPLAIASVAELKLRRRPARLPQKVWVLVERDHVRPASREFDRVEAGVASDIERVPAAEIVRQVRADIAPLERGEIAERMIRRGLRAVGQM